MQAVLWVAFAGTLALAGYISHRRNGSLSVELGEPTVFGNVRVRLPKGWAREERTDARPAVLVARERDEEGWEDLKRRKLWITQERQAQAKKGPAYYLHAQYGIPDDHAEPFNFLGGRGVLLVWRGLPPGMLNEVDDAIVRQIPEAGLYACTVLSDGLTVTIQVRGQGAFGPTNRQLIRQVADTMSVADTPATRLPTAISR